MVTLQPSRFAAYEYKNKVYKVHLPKDHTIEQIIDPAYWMHVCRFLKSGDEIIAVAEDNSYRLHLYVVSSFSTTAQVAVVAFTEFSKEFTVPVEADTNYIIEHSGNFHKWRVRHKDQDKPLVAQLETREQAIKWLIDYKKALVVNRRVVDTDAA